MTQQQTDSNGRAGAGDDTTAEGRRAHAANKRVEQLRGGLEKAVSGREDKIKLQAVKWAEQLDERTQGRHHNKIHVALKAVEFIVDNAARKRDAEAGGSGSKRETSGGSFADVPGAKRGRADATDDLGEFRNLNDERAAK